MGCNQCSCFVEALQNSEDPRKACHLIAPACAYTSGSHQESTEPANAGSLHWVGYPVEEDGERILTDIYSGHYELLPPSDVDSVHFLPHPQKRQHTAAQQRESTSEQQLPERMQTEKKWYHQQQGTHRKNQREQHTAIEDQQRREQQQHAQQRSFCSTFPCASFVSISQLTHRLISSWTRFLNRLLSTGRSPKRRLVPPFPCDVAESEKESRLDSKDAKGEEKDSSSEYQARHRRDGGENREENRGGARAKGDINNGETHLKGTKTEGGEEVVQMEEKRGDWRERACTAGESEASVSCTTVKNIYSPHAGKVSGKRPRPPLFEVTVYWSAGNVNRDCSKDEGGERKYEDWQTGEEADRAEKRTADRRGGRAREKETKNEQVKRTLGEECGGKEKEWTELEETLQLVQNLNNTFMFCSARDEGLGGRRTRARMHSEEKETRRNRDRVSSAEGGDQREEGHDSRAGEELVGRRDQEEEGNDRKEETERFEERESVFKEQEKRDGNANKKWEAAKAKGNEEKAKGKRNGTASTKQRGYTGERNQEPVKKQRNKGEVKNSLRKEEKGEEEEGNQEAEFAEEGEKKEEMTDSAAVELEKKMQQSFVEEASERDFADEVEDAAFEFVSPELRRELERREMLEKHTERRKRQERWLAQSRLPVCEKDKQHQYGKEEKNKVHMRCSRSSGAGAASGSQKNRRSGQN